MSDKMIIQCLVFAKRTARAETRAALADERIAPPAKTAFDRQAWRPETTVDRTKVQANSPWYTFDSPVNLNRRQFRRLRQLAAGNSDVQIHVLRVLNNTHGRGLRKVKRKRDELNFVFSEVSVE